MDTQRTVIEKKAYGIAAANFLSFSDSAFDADPYLAYLEYEAAVDEGRDPDGLVVWAPFENYDDVLNEIEKLANHIEREINDVLRLAHQGIIHETIECRVDGDMNMLDLDLMISVGDTLEKGGCVKALYHDEEEDLDEVSDEVEIDSVEPKPDQVRDDLDVGLRRHEVAVTRVAYSSEKRFSVLAASKDEAEAKALEMAYNEEFSSESAEYECDVQLTHDALPAGAVICWRDPSTGEEQDVIYRKSHGEIVLCHTFGGGELEALTAELS